ncbi:hypothetical protein [Roseomonas gilardii]|uniref:hypothetical protein n=1 Tax=Roseomonas gilardii TaxID=257708 RepID=UPI0004BABD55|nr:hypothetical protein [Roseomonas gilardii]MDU7520853.1 hypothetical protein [Roseomonas mucosa]SUE42531.1 Uncharacterised protein [Roseomonas gilardii subsp. rosea]
MDEALVTRVAEDIRLWTGVEPPNETGRQMASMDIPKLIADFEALRGTLRFEDEPSSFEAALQSCKERA